ncbi:MAG: DUF58 domain-containing protein [Acidobacteria bacterium]|nr:DUF58 domain-containing protein [Acidobacteriota bacterium]
MTVADRARRRWHLAPGRPVTLPRSTGPATLASRAATLRRLELDVTRRLDGLVSGDHLAYATGPGSERTGARPYEPGDDARRIDWSLTARAGSAHVRTTEADRELETWVVADRSASLDFGTARHEKRELVLAATAAFGALTVRGGNRLGVLIAGGDQLLTVPARTGRTALFAALARLHDTERMETAPGAGSDLAAALLRAERTVRRRGRVVVLSDFLDATGWVTPLRRLALRHEVVAGHITDPRELELPAVGILTAVDTETGRQVHVQTNSAELRTRYRAAATERADSIRRAIATAGAEYLPLSTDRDWLLDVATFINQRAARAMSRPARIVAP